jgi:transposase
MGIGRTSDPTHQARGRRRTIDVREVLKAIFHVLSTSLPSDLPPKSTVYNYLDLWDWDGTLERIHHALYVAAREQAGREASPECCHHRPAERQRSGKRGASLGPSGYDAGKKLKGRKRHILADTLGLLLNVVVHPADVQDRDGAAVVLRQARRSFPFIGRI